MRNNLYKIRTIKALDIFHFGKKYSPSEDIKETPYNFDGNDTEYIITMSTVSLIQANPLFYQIEREKKSKKSDPDSGKQESSSNENIIKESDPHSKKQESEFNENIINDIIYVDFNDIYLADEKEDALSYSDEMRALLKYGFSLTYKETNVHYVKFERSGSMAREKKLSFIRKDLKDNLEKALRLDLKPASVVLSKWYAYNGLMLSSGIRINLPEGMLNAESVIVVKDKVVGKDPVKSNLFDGEGIISNKLASALRENLVYDKSNANALPTSFQIRMPYVKGMLYQVDFHSFAKEPDINGKTITDCWGIEHQVDKVHIILTESMFKGKEWFEEAVKNSQQSVMNYYFTKFKEDEHALYVTGYNKPQPKWINLNYQVLSTPNLKQENFLKLGEATEDIYKALTPNIDNNQSNNNNDSQQNLIQAFLDNVDYFLPADEGQKDEENPDADAQDATVNDAKNTYSRYDTGIRKAVKLRPELINSKKAKDCIKNMADHTLMQYGKARFRCQGLNLYLSGDLLYFLYYIFNKEKEIPEIEKLYNDKFYAPGVKCRIDQWYAVLRNPHISNKELISLMALKPYVETKRYKYLNHLKGVLMINSSIIRKLIVKMPRKLKNKKLIPISISAKFKNKEIPFLKPVFPSIAEHLSGADYDGDIVKLINDKTYNNAMPEFSDWSTYKFEPIPKPDVSSVNLNAYDIEENIYKMLAMTFGNRIGMFSNYAFKHAVHAYNANDVEGNKGYKEAKIKEKQDKLVELKKKKKEEAGKTVTDQDVEAIRKEVEAENVIVRYTGEAVDKLFNILGQEIDSAKTGKRPSIDNELVIKGDDYFIEWKNTINNVLKESKINTKSESEVSFENYPISPKIKDSIIVPSASNSKLPNFYVLPYKTFELKGLTYNKEKKVLVKPKGKTGPTEGEKQFNIGEFIQKNISSIAKIEFYSKNGYDLVRDFITIVNNYNEAIANLNKKKHSLIEFESRKESKTVLFTNEYMAILFKQYNGYAESRTIMCGIVDALKEWRKTNTDVDINTMKQEWIYSIEPETYLKEHFKNGNGEYIFEEDSSKTELLCNFSYCGYKLLIIALNLACEIDLNLQNGSENSRSEKNNKYRFDKINTIKEIEYTAKKYINKIFSKINKNTSEDEKIKIIKKRLGYYAFCANIQNEIAQNVDEIFKEIAKEEYFYTRCKYYYNKYLKSQNNNTDFTEYLNNLKKKAEKKNFIAKVLLYRDGYKFDESENFLWSILGKDLLEMISANNSPNNDADTENNKINKEDPQSND